MSGNVASTALAALIVRAHQEQPELTVDDDALAAHVAAVTPEDKLDTAHAGDLALAVGCRRGDPASLRLFERQHGPMLRAAVAAVDRDPGFVDDVIQELRQRLFVGDGEAPPRIVRYAGTGPLGGWLRVAVLRLAIDQRRRTWRDVPIDDALVPDAPTPAADDPQRVRDHAVIRGALRAAIVTQSSRNRTLLRYYYAEQVGLQELGAIYKVNASTISRWLAAARTEVFAETRRQLAATLRATPDDVESHLGLVQSLDVSLGSLLQTPGG